MWPQERAKLEAYREAVRAKYEEVGLGNETPADLPKPLWVGQAVTARHPITRQIHEGSVLTVNPNHYRQVESPCIWIQGRLGVGSRLLMSPSLSWRC